MLDVPTVGLGGLAVVGVVLGGRAVLGSGLAVLGAGFTVLLSENIYANIFEFLTFLVNFFNILE